MKPTFYNDYGCCPTFNETETCFMCETCLSVYCLKCAEQHKKADWAREHSLTHLEKYVENHKCRIRTGLQNSIEECKEHQKYMKTIRESKERRWDFTSQELLDNIDSIFKGARKMAERSAEIEALIGIAAELLKEDRDLTAKDYMKMERINNVMENFKTYAKTLKVMKELDRKFMLFDKLKEQKEEVVSAARAKYMHVLKIVREKHVKLEEVTKELEACKVKYETLDQNMKQIIKDANQLHEKALEEHDKEILRLQNERNKKIAELDQKVAKHAEISKTKMQSLDKNVMALTYKLKTVKEDLKTLNINKKVLTENVGELENSRARLEAKIVELKKDLKNVEEAKMKYEELRLNIKIREEKLNTLKRQEEEYKEIEERTKIAANKLQELQEKIKESRKQKAELEPTNKKLTVLKAMAITYGDATSMHKKVQAKLENLEVQKDFMSKEYSMITEKCEKFIKTQRETLEKMKEEIGIKTQQLNILNEDINAQEQKKKENLKCMNNVNESYRKVIQDLSNAKDKLEKVNTDRAKVLHDLNMLNKKKDATNKEISSLNHTSEEFKKIIAEYNGNVDKLLNKKEAIKNYLVEAKKEKLNLIKEKDQLSNELGKEKRKYLEATTEHSQKINEFIAEENNLANSIKSLKEESHKLSEEICNLKYESAEVKKKKDELSECIRQLNTEITMLQEKKLHEDNEYTRMHKKCEKAKEYTQKLYERIQFSHDTTRRMWNVLELCTNQIGEIGRRISFQSQQLQAINNEAAVTFFRERAMWITCKSTSRYFTGLKESKYFLNTISECGIDFWVSLLKHLGYTKYLSLSLCEFNAIDKSPIPCSLASFTRRCKNLRTLDLTGNMISCSSIYTLLEALEGHPLRCLIIDNNTVHKNTDIMKAVAEKIPKTCIEHLSAKDTPLNGLIEELDTKGCFANSKLKCLSLYYEEKDENEDKYKILIDSMVARYPLLHLKLEIRYKKEFPRNILISSDKEEYQHDCAW